jgi:hypothetical protein
MGFRYSFALRQQPTRNIKDEEVHIDVVPAFSALSVLANYQIQGYHLMPK